MADIVPYQNIIDKLKGEVVQVGTDCTVNVYNITKNYYYNHPPPTDQGQGQQKVTVQEEVKVEVIKSDGRPRKSAKPSSFGTFIDGRGQSVVLKPGDLLTDLWLYPKAIYIGDGMILRVRGGTVIKERLGDMNGFCKGTPSFKSGVRVFPKMEVVRRAKGKVGSSFRTFHEFICWCFTGLTCKEAYKCDQCFTRDLKRTLITWGGKPSAALRPDFKETDKLVTSLRLKTLI